MEPMQRPSESNAQKNVGLADAHYRRYLVSPLVTDFLPHHTEPFAQKITLDVAKELVRELAEDHPHHEGKFHWRDVTWKMEANAVTRVNADLAAEEIDKVEDAWILERLKKALKDSQRSQHVKRQLCPCD
jgi:hypothetical protein